MRIPKPRRIFQILGLAACIVVGIRVTAACIFQSLAEPAGKPLFGFQGSLVMVVVIPMVLILGFVAVFWWTTQLGALEAKSRKLGIFLLTIQVLLAFLTSTDLLYIIAAETPFVFPGMSGVIWLTAQCVASAGFAAFAAAKGLFLPSEGLTHAPYMLAVMITVLDVLSWSIFAFGVGYLVVREETGRRLLARTNNELTATQVLLADSSRLAERIRISRELHDVIGNRLAALSIHLQIASRLATEAVSEPVRDAQTVTKLLLADVRDVVGGLREECRVNLGQALTILTREIAAPRIHLAVSKRADTLDPARAHAFFRCTQEAITNAIKYSHARNLWIILEHEASVWKLSIRDDGVGIDTITENNGLRGIRERLEAFGGKLAVETKVGHGFQLWGIMPNGETSL